MEYALHEYLDEPVTIGNARLLYRNGILVTITDFSMGRPEVMHIDVKKLEISLIPFPIR